MSEKTLEIKISAIDLLKLLAQEKREYLMNVTERRDTLLVQLIYSMGGISFFAVPLDETTLKG